MAADWQDTTLGSVTDFLSGGTPSKDRAEYWVGTIPWVSAKDMKRFRLDDSEDHVSAEGAINGTRTVPAGSVLLLARGMTLLNDVPICVANRPVTFNQDVKALRPKPGTRQEFLPYLLLGNKDRLLGLVDLAGHGTGRLNSDELKALEIKLPPDREQRAIAHILGTLDDKIELNRKMNETLEATARALFKSWFVDFDPVRAKAEGRDPGLPPRVADLFPDSFEDSELGEIPAGWEIRSLDLVATYLNGLALQKYPPVDENWLPVIKIAQLRAGHSSGADRASSNVPSAYVVQDGDVLFSWSGSLEVEIWCGGPGALNQHLFKVTSSEFPKWFYYYWTREHLSEFRSIAAGKATTMGHIQRGHLTAAKALVPREPLLDTMDHLMSPLLDRVLAARLQSRTLAALRDSLLPKLISGELRVTDPESFVERAV